MYVIKDKRKLIAKTKRLDHDWGKHTFYICSHFHNSCPVLHFVSPVSNSDLRAQFHIWQPGLRFIPGWNSSSNCSKYKLLSTLKWKTKYWRVVQYFNKHDQLYHITIAAELVWIYVYFSFQENTSRSNNMKMTPIRSMSADMLTLKIILDDMQTLIIMSS